MPSLRRFAKRTVVEPTRRLRWQLTGDRARSRVFSEIYATGGWPDEDETRSGPGSDLTQTTKVREFLPELVRDLALTSILDAPCGDFHWLKYCDLAGIDYTGVDIVPELIESNRQRFGDAQHKFEVADIVKDLLPRSDLVLCRDCLVHLPFAQGLEAVRNFRRSGAGYVLTTTFTNLTKNTEINRIGEWRRLNLEAPPFSFPVPVRILNEECTSAGGRYADKSLGLWNLRELNP
jgi:SAM-dependent methyltransferase